jgi:hypothetical protein
MSEEDYEDDLSSTNLNEVEEEEPKKVKTKKKSKKRKNREYQEEEDEATHQDQKKIIPEELQADELHVRRTTKANLKRLKIAHPNVDTSGLRKLDAELDQLTTAELIDEYNNIRTAVGLINPGETSKGFVGLLGMGLGRMVKSDTLADDLTNNHELLTEIEHYIPEFAHWLAPPIKIAYLVAGAVTKASREKK